MILCIFEYVHVILASNKYEKHEKVYQFLHIFTKIKEKYYQNVHEFEEKKKTVARKFKLQSFTTWFLQLIVYFHAWYGTTKYDVTNLFFGSVFK